MTRLKHLCGALLIGCLAALATPAYATNDAMLKLIDIMQAKGTLTRAEADALRQAAVQDAEQTEAIKKDVDKQIAESSKSSASDWTKNIKLKGDMRLRYQYQNGKGVGKPADGRDRGRIRYRLGIIAKPEDKLEVGAGLASGGDDPRSTNQTFQDAFSTKGIQLDYAYVKYDVTDNFTGIAGKFGQKGSLWQATDLMWDGDINPEGFSGNFKFNNGFGKAFLSGGIWVIDESGSAEDDPYLGYAQLGQSFESGNVFGTVSGAYFGFQEFTAPPCLGCGSNVTLAGGSVGNTDKDFTVLNFSGEIGVKDLFAKGIKGSIFGDYVNNVDTSTSYDSGFSVGGKLTNGMWTLKYIYADLDANAVPDFLPDSDRYDGQTDMKGHELIAEYKIWKHTTLGLDYYHTKDKGQDSNNTSEQNILQADVVVKF